MNNLLLLKGILHSKPNTNRGNQRLMTKDKTLSLDHYVNLAYEIRELIKY